MPRIDVFSPFGIRYIIRGAFDVARFDWQSMRELSDCGTGSMVSSTFFLFSVQPHFNVYRRLGAVGNGKSTDVLEVDVLL